MLKGMIPKRQDLFKRHLPLKYFHLYIFAYLIVFPSATNPIISACYR